MRESERERYKEREQKRGRERKLERATLPRRQRARPGTQTES